MLLLQIMRVLQKELTALKIALQVLLLSDLGLALVQLICVYMLPYQVAPVRMDILRAKVVPTCHNLIWSDTKTNVEVMTRGALTISFHYFVYKKKESN